MKFDIWFLRKSIEKIQVSLKSDKRNGALREYQYNILTISLSVFLSMRNISDAFVGKIWTQILCSAPCFVNRAVYEIMWKNTVERGRPQMTMWRMCVAPTITNSTNTHSEYCFSATTMVARTPLSVTLYAQWLSFLIFYTTCHFLNLIYLNANYVELIFLPKSVIHL
jgi:hypothetical protein